MKAINDIARSNRLIPTLLVFSTYLRLLEILLLSLLITARAIVIRKAIAKIRKIKAAWQITNALTTYNGPDVTKVLQLPL